MKVMGSKKDYLIRKFINILKDNVEKKNDSIMRQSYEQQVKQILKAMNVSRIIKTASPDKTR